MIVMILENVPASQRGELNRWLIEVRAGIFIGHTSARVRDRLWENCCKAAPGSGIIQAWSSNTEQRFKIRTNGPTSRQIVDMDGLKLVQLPHDLDQRADGSIIKARLKRLRQTTISGDEAID